MINLVTILPEHFITSVTLCTIHGKEINSKMEFVSWLCWKDPKVSWGGRRSPHEEGRGPNFDLGYICLQIPPRSCSVLICIVWHRLSLVLKYFWKTICLGNTHVTKVRSSSLCIVCKVVYCLWKISKVNCWPIAWCTCVHLFFLPLMAEQTNKNPPLCNQIAGTRSP